MFSPFIYLFKEASYLKALVRKKFVKVSPKFPVSEFFPPENNSLRAFSFIGWGLKIEEDKWWTF